MKTCNLIKKRIAVQQIFFLILGGFALLSVNRWHFNIPSIEFALKIVGWLAMGLGIMGRVWAGSFICGFKNQKLMQEGAYSVCRNPLYFFSFIAGMGVMLITGTFLFPIFFSAVFLSYYRKIIRQEEKRLLSICEKEFLAYCKKVPRFWPNFSLYKEPVSYTVVAKPFRNHVRDAIWFLVAGGAIALIEEMHLLGYLPTSIYIF